MATHQITITGVPRTLPQDIAPARREINDLIQDKMQFSLYIQALQVMSAQDQNDLLSFFQIGGIHGLPYVPWDNAQGTNSTGYCTHGSVLFPTWHRPYVLLFEQTLQAHAAAIAETYTTADKPAWQDAALRLRAPYWDSSRISIPPPEVIELAQVSIITPDSNGTEVPVDNPLLSYTFHPQLQNPSPSAAGRPKTVRNPPPTGTETNLVALIDSVTGADGQPDKYRADTFKMLTRVDTWMGMSNHTSKHKMDFNRDAANSLEAIHDGVHGDVGGSGQFGEIAVAAFDPIFWLHHCNVDRLLALWQTLHPDIWVTSSDQIRPTFTIDPAATVDERTSLTPFWNAANSFLTSREVRDWTRLNYTYPEFENLDLGDPQAVYDAIIDVVFRLYGDEEDLREAGITAQPSAMRAAAVPQAMDMMASPAESAPQVAAQVAAAAPKAQIVIGSRPQQIAQQKIDWTVRVRCKQYALGLSYTVLIFVGPAPEDESKWRSSPSFVGEHVVFTNSAVEKCSNCLGNAELVTEGYVDLMKNLKQSKVASYEPEVVVQYLKNNLHWRIQKTDAQVIPAAELESLEVAVLSVRLEYSKQHKCYKMAADARPEHHDELTIGRPGGSSTHPPASAPA